MKGTIFSCNISPLEQNCREIEGRLEKWQRLRGRSWWVLCVLLGDHWSVPFPPLNGQGCCSASFHLIKIHTNMHRDTHLHTLTCYPWPPTPISRPPLYPACWSLHPSLHPVLSKQMRSCLRLKLPVLPVYPVHHLFSSSSHAHLCNICVWVCWGICRPSVYAVVLTDLLWRAYMRVCGIYNRIFKPVASWCWCCLTVKDCIGLT